MFRKLRIPIIIVVTALLTQAVGLAVHAAMPESYRPVGSTRYVVDFAQDEVTTNSTAMVDIPGLAQSITIPAGKRGDVFVFYCGTGNVDVTGTELYVRARIGTSLAGPGMVTLDKPSFTNYQQRCANFYRLNVPEGTRVVRMQWWGSNAAATQSLWGRSMFVIVNLHD